MSTKFEILQKHKNSSLITLCDKINYKINDFQDEFGCKNVNMTQKRVEIEVFQKKKKLKKFTCLCLFFFKSARQKFLKLMPCLFQLSYFMKTFV